MHDLNEDVLVHWSSESNYLWLSLAFVPGTSENKMKMLCTPRVHVQHVERSAVDGTAVLPRPDFLSPAD